MKLPELHVYHPKGARVDTLLWKAGYTGEVVDLTEMFVKKVRRDVEVGDLPIAEVHLFALLVEHGEGEEPEIRSSAAERELELKRRFSRMHRRAQKAESAAGGFRRRLFAAARIVQELAEPRRPS